MTTSQLINRIEFCKTGYGHFKITIMFRGKKHACTTTNTMAIDRMQDEDTRIDKCAYYSTVKQAATALYNECKQANNLN